MLERPEVKDPERDFAPPDEKATALAMTMTAQISQNRQIVLQTYVARDEDVLVYHQVLDKLSAAIERQEAKQSLEAEEANLAVETVNLKNLQEDFPKIEERAKTAWDASGRKGAYRPSAQELAQKQQVLTNIDVYKAKIEKRRAEIARLRRLVAAGERDDDIPY